MNILIIDPEKKTPIDLIWELEKEENKVSLTTVLPDIRDEIFKKDFSAVFLVRDNMDDETQTYISTLITHYPNLPAILITGEQEVMTIKKTLSPRGGPSNVIQKETDSNENLQIVKRFDNELDVYSKIIDHLHTGIVVIDQNNKIMFANTQGKIDLDLDPGFQGEQITNYILSISHDIGLEKVPIGDTITLIPNPGSTNRFELTRIDNQLGMITSSKAVKESKIDQIKSDLITNLTHDLRSPLTAILGYVELIERVGEVNTKQHQFMIQVEQSVKQITGMIDSLLELERIEAGFDTSKEPVQFDRIMEESINGLEILAELQGISINTSVQGDNFIILGNSIRLRQMVDNLINNAIKYSSSGGVINIRIIRREKHIIFEVEDQGEGIPIEEQNEIFNRFYRGQNLSIEKIGSGLGLAIVKSITENHNGRVWVNSTIGKGSIFTVLLPTF